MRAIIWPCLLTTAAALPPLAGGVEPKANPAAALRPLAEDAWDLDKARHLLFRAGLGGTPAEVSQLHSLGLRKAVEWVVAYSGQPDVEIPPPAAGERPDPAELRKLTPQERQKRAQELRRNDQLRMAEVRHWWVKRMLRSPRPLEEKLVLFWHGHFATEYRTVRNSQAMQDQNQLFREHAAGNFGKLLHALLRDPAMLRYLDNNRNTRVRPNENLAREIMELFAMGVDQGYTENDIKEGARALTGHTFEPRTGKYRYAAGSHDGGSKTIFGKTGRWDGDQFVKLILEQPATARFLARKLFVYFAHDHPDEGVIHQLAGTLRDNNYELAPLLRALFRSEEFYSERARGTQVKCPVQLVVGTLRVLRVGDADPAAIAAATRALRQDLFEPPNVKGWEGGRAWNNTNTVFARANFPALLLGGTDRAGRKEALGAKRDRPALARPLSKTFDVLAYLRAEKLETAEVVVDHFANALFVAGLSKAKRAELVQFLGPLPAPDEWEAGQRAVKARVSALLVLMLGLPEYQLT